jgi:isopentenyl diphosphate isomerase/L-lactate dehydrogenase-like FMN-dependent dehydrogenase
MTTSEIGRRNFLRFVAASPLVYSASQLGTLRDLLDGNASAAETLDAVDKLIESAAQAINVFDFEPVARQRQSAAHWTYMSMGVDGEETLRANREGFQKFNLRARRLVDVSNVDLSTSVLGEDLSTPIIVAPTGGQGAYHPDGDKETARGARAAGNLMMYSTAATFGVEDVIEARGESVWYQLYPTSEWRITEAILKRAEAAGCKLVALTVDVPARNTEKMGRFNRTEDPECLACHDPDSGFGDKPMLRGLGLPPGSSPSNPGMTWDFVRRIRDTTSMKLIIKGVSTAEDASLCVEHGLDGLVLSNHGGRGDESGRSTIETLPEVAAAVNGRIPIIIDGGFRRGTDVVKALAMGASAVGVGRPYLWGLGSFGKDGVERVLQILNRELTIAMQQAGTPTIPAITGDAVRSAG